MWKHLFEPRMLKCHNFESAQATSDPILIHVDCKAMRHWASTFGAGTHDGNDRLLSHFIGGDYEMLQSDKEPYLAFALRD